MQEDSKYVVGKVAHSQQRQHLLQAAMHICSTEVAEAEWKKEGASAVMYND
jgi:hypothetical protein